MYKYFILLCFCPLTTLAQSVFSVLDTAKYSCIITGESYAFIEHTDFDMACIQYLIENRKANTLFIELPISSQYFIDRYKIEGDEAILDSFFNKYYAYPKYQRTKIEILKTTELSKKYNYPFVIKAVATERNSSTSAEIVAKIMNDNNYQKLISDSLLYFVNYKKYAFNYLPKYIDSVLNQDSLPVILKQYLTDIKQGILYSMAITRDINKGSEFMTKVILDHSKRFPLTKYYAHFGLLYTKYMYQNNSLDFREKALFFDLNSENISDRNYIKSIGHNRYELFFKSLTVDF